MEMKRPISPMCEALGAHVVSQVKDENHKKFLTEKYGIVFKEDANTVTAAGATTTVLTDTLYDQALRSIEDLLGLVDTFDIDVATGTGSVKLPILDPTNAVVLAEGVDPVRYTEGVRSITVTPQKVVASTRVTWEIMKRGMSQYLNRILSQAADAVARKLGSDIINGLSTGAAAANAVAGGIDYAAISESIRKINSSVTSAGVPLDFKADTIVMTQTAWESYSNDSDYKSTTYNANFVQGVDGMTVARQFQTTHGLKIITSQLLTASGVDAVVLQAKRAAVLVREGTLETYEDRISGGVDNEIIAVQSYALAVIYPQAISNINT